MEFALGDIVAHAGDRFVLAAVVGSSLDTRQEPARWSMEGFVVRLIARSANGVTTQTTRHSSALTLVEAPAFAGGERVTVNGLAGTVVSTDAANGLVNVALDARDRPLTSDPRFRVTVSDGIAAVPRWQLVLENRF